MAFCSRATTQSLLAIALLAFSAPAAFAQQLSVTDAAITEGNSGTKLLNFTLKLSAAKASAVFVDVATANQSATAGSDYTAYSVTGLRIPAGAVNKTVSISILGDTTPEPDETFSINLSNAVGATLSDAQGIGTITNDDAAPAPVLSVGDVSVPEGNSGTTQASFLVQLSQPATSTVSFDIATSDGSAQAGVDYAAASSQGVTFLAGESQKAFVVNVNGDAVVEPDETFQVQVSNVTGATLGDGSAVGTITNDDAQSGPALSIGDIAPAEGGPGEHPVTFTVRLSEPSDTWVTFDVSTADGTANGYDYVGTNVHGAYIAPGDTTFSFTMTAFGDNDFEPDETFTLNISNLSGNAHVVDGQATVTLINDDAPGLTVDDLFLSEGNSGSTTAQVTVKLAEPSAVPVTFDIATADETATAGSDYLAFSLAGQTIPAGQMSKSFPVTIYGDTTPEYYEDFKVNVSNVSGTTVSKPSARMRIGGDDGLPQPYVYVQDAQIVEGDAGVRFMQFQVVVSGSAPSGVHYDIQTSDGTATAGTDYVADHRVAQFIPPGQSSATFAVQINSDTSFEPDELFNATLSNVVGATRVGEPAVGRIVNDDVSSDPVLSVGDTIIFEGDGSVPQALTFTVSLSKPAAVDTTFIATPAGLTATAGVDFNAQPIPVVIPAGATSLWVMVPVLGDTFYEPKETLTLTLSDVSSNVYVADGQGLGTIFDDDLANIPALTVGDASVVEGNSGTSVLHFPVSLSRAAGSPVCFLLQLTAGSATAGSDYVDSSADLCIRAGQSSLAFDVTVNGDTLVEPNESLVLTASSVTGATVADGTGTGTIANDDASAAPTLSIADVSVTEGNSATKLATFTVTLSAPQSTAVTFDIATANGTATAGSDYVAKATTGLRIAAGATSKTFAVSINGDTTQEPDETFFVNLSNAVGAALGDGSAVGTITNDDSGGGGGTPALSIADASIAEGNSLTRQLTFTVKLSAAAAGPVTYNIATANGSAVAPSDYTAKSLTGQSIAAGATSKTFTVAIKGDTLVEPNETFTVNVSGVAGATVADAQAVGTITNDDAAALGIARFDARGLVDDIDDGNRQPVVGGQDYATLLLDSAQSLCARTGSAAVVAVEDVENKRVLADLALAAAATCARGQRFEAVMVESDRRGFLIDATAVRLLRAPEVLGDARATRLDVQAAGAAPAVMVVLAEPAICTSSERTAQQQVLSATIQQATAAQRPLVLLGACPVAGLVEVKEAEARPLPDADRVFVNPVLLDEFAHARVVLVPQSGDKSAAPVLQLQQ
jgi:hypothetical protein